MNSTKEERFTVEIRDFFEKELMPLAKKMQQEGVSFFSLVSNPDVHTYYVDRDKIITPFKNCEMKGYDSIDDCIQALTELWILQGYSKLAALAPTLSKITKLCRSLEQEEEQKGEVSPSMYVLF